MTTVLILLGAALTVGMADALLRTLSPLWWRRLTGSRRLRHGFCPTCASSPPIPGCLVCHGSYDYGNRDSGLGTALSPSRRATWRQRWIAHGYPLDASRL